MSTTGSEPRDGDRVAHAPESDKAAEAAPSGSSGLVGNVLLILSSMLLTLVGAELFLRTFPQFQIQTSDGEYRYCTENRIRHRPHVAFGYTEVPGSSYFERYSPADPWYYIHVNAEGFRDNYETNGRPVVVLGDSSTRGSLVNEDETFANLMDKWHPEWSFRNYGAGGYGQANAIRIYEEKAPSAPHDLVIQQYSLANDLDDNVERAVLDGDSVKITVRPATGKPKEALGPLVRIHQFFWQHSKVYPWLYNVTVRSYAENWDARRNIDGSIEITRRLLAKLAEEARANRADLLLLVLPSWAEMAGRHDGMEPMRQREMLEAFALATPNVYLLDMTSVLTTEDPDKTYGVLDKHMTAYGHFLVAQALERWMVTDWPHGPRKAAPERIFQPPAPVIPDCSQADAYLALASSPATH